jgi:hypothetical protein
MAVDYKAILDVYKQVYNEPELRRIQEEIYARQDLVATPRLWVSHKGTLRIPDKYQDFCNMWGELGRKLEQFERLDRLSNQAKRWYESR